MIPKLYLFAVFALACLVSACSASDDSQPLIPVPDMLDAPDFILEDPQGNLVRLADYRGKPLIVNFWATWCPPCRAEMPSMERAWQVLRKEGIELIAINVGEDAATVSQFLSEVSVGFPMPLDTDSEVVQRWPVRGLPTTYIVDPEGHLMYRAVGERDWDAPEVMDLVRALKRD